MPISIYHDKDATLRDAFDTLNSYTGITQLTPGGKARAIIEILANENSNLAQSFDIEIAEAFVRTASRDSLDLIGELVGVNRLEAKKANVDAAHGNIKFHVISGTFGDITGGIPVTIPKGTALSAQVTIGSVPQIIKYIVTEDVELLPAVSEVYVSASSADAGSKSSVGPGSINKHGFAGYLDYQNESLKIINVSGITGGIDRESDVNYRYRISNAVLSSEGANETAVRLAALSVAGVADIVGVPYDRGTGSFSVYIKSVYPIVSDALINKVQEAVDKSQAFGNTGLAKSPKNVGIEVSVTINYRSPVTDNKKLIIESLAEDTITAYCNNLDIGEPFISQQLINSVLNIDENIESIGRPDRPFDDLYIYRDSRLSDNRVKQSLISDYVAYFDERVIVEPTISSPVIVRSS